MTKSYLDEFEKKTSYGGYIFWAVTFYYLKRLVEGVAEEPEGVDFASSHEFTFQELIDHCGRCLEMNQEAQKAIKQVILSYPDLATGYQIAILKLQTEFIYTGKPDRDLIVMAAARHPE